MLKKYYGVMMMNERDSSKKGELFIVDNSDIAWKVQKI